MSVPSDDERGLRFTLLALVALVPTAGCRFVPGMGGDAGDSSPAPDSVSEGSTAVAYTDE